VNTQVFALHGFLGACEDWNPVFKFIAVEKPAWQLRAVDIFKDIGDGLSYEKWAENFCQWVRSQSPGQRRLLLGYSMGGRLALHALEQDPDLWDGVVFLSTNPGLSNAAEKLERIQSDLKWAQRFSEEERASVLKDWNAQALFHGASGVGARDENFETGNVVHSLTAWSLGRQKDFRQTMDLWHVRQIWAAGGKDRKFSDLLKTLPVSTDIQKWVVEDAAHRLLLEAPEEVAHFVVRVGSPILDGAAGASHNEK
jgi:2-succinyl-6-hydroxy-2,4-cyclohexadiene-1-carboxylate synthase